jgi:hypothetical protein
MFRYFLKLIILILFIFSCKKKQSTIEINNSTLNCSDTVNVSYVNQIEPLLTKNCVSCHFKGSTMDLSDYTTVSALAMEGSLKGSITGETEYRLMPPNGKLDTCAIRKIVFWTQQGCKNN